MPEEKDGSDLPLMDDSGEEIEIEFVDVDDDPADSAPAGISIDSMKSPVATTICSVSSMRSFASSTPASVISNTRGLLP